MKPFWLMAIFACALAAQQDPSSLFQHAVSAQQSGDFAAAAKDYQALLKLQPDNIGVRSNYGVVLTQLGRFDDAIVQYEAARKLAPADPRIAVNLAIAYSKSGRVHQAAELLETLPDRSQQATMLLADCHLQLGNNSRVIELLEPLPKDDPAIAYMLGTALVRDHRADQGQVLLNRLLSNGDSAEARFLLGTQMFASGDYPAAIKQLASAVELNPSVPELQAYYGRALLLTGDPVNAAEAFRKELVGNPNNYLASLSLGQILIESKKFQEAKPLLERALLSRPQSAEAMESLGRAEAGLEQWNKARAHLEAAQKSGVDSPELHQSLADVYAHLNNPAKSQHERAAAAKRKPADGPAIGDIAPLFTLPKSATNEPVALKDFRGKSPVVLVFGSYSCPNFRASSEALQTLQTKYGQRVPFFLVYIKEAHTRETWETARNAGIDVPNPANLEEKQEHAQMCSRKLHLRFPALTDGMDGAVEAAYAAWPTKAVVIGANGRILYTTRLTDLDFHAPEMEAALRRGLTASAPLQSR